MARIGRSFPLRAVTKRPDLGTVYFDNSSTSAYEAALSTYNWNHTVGLDSNRLLVVGVSIFAACSVSSITYGGVALTKLRHDDTGVYRSEIWYLIAPASGTAAIAVTLNASLTSIASAASWRNVDQTTPFSANAGATGTNTPASAAVTPGSVLNRVFGNLSAQSASGVTDQIRQAPHYTATGALGTQIGAELGTILTATSTTLQWNNLGALDSWAVSVAAIQPPQAVTQVYGWDASLPAYRPAPRSIAAYSLSTPTVVPQHEATEGNALGWIPRYPDSIPRWTLRTASQLTYAVTPLQPAWLPDLSWRAIYPDRVIRGTLPVAQQLAFVTGSTASSLPVPELSWTAVYPARIDRLTVRAADQPVFTTGSTASSLPVPPLSWAAVYPDRIARTTLPVSSHPTFSFDALARPPALQIVAWSVYPDQVLRPTMHPARMPAFTLGTLDPIPNPVSTGVRRDKLVLGQKSSLDVSTDPVLGGGQSW